VAEAKGGTTTKREQITRNHHIREAQRQQLTDAKVTVKGKQDRESLAGKLCLEERGRYSRNNLKWHGGKGGWREQTAPTQNRPCRENQAPAQRRVKPTEPVYNISGEVTLATGDVQVVDIFSKHKVQIINRRGRKGRQTSPLQKSVYSLDILLTCGTRNHLQV